MTTENLKHWLYTLAKTVIGGVAATGSAWLGTVISAQVDHSIPILEWKQLGSVLVSSSLLNLFFFLKQSPLPDDGTAVTIQDATTTANTTNTTPKV